MNHLIPQENGQGAAFSPEMLRLVSGNAGMFADYAKAVLETMVGYKELMMMYSCAIKEVRTKFEVLSTEYNTRYQRNPITAINTRLKSTSSIMEKVARKNIAFSLPNIEENITDIAGIRVVCSYVDDIYRLADSLCWQNDVTLLSKKDYIASPKPNGYRSLHMIIAIPVFFAEQRKEMKVEVQIRTIAMDFWASLEHQMKYKQEIPQQEQIVSRLKACADVIAKTDEEMLALRRELEAAQEKPSADEELLEKLRKLTEPF